MIGKITTHHYGMNNTKPETTIANKKMTLLVYQKTQKKEA
jgi:hypothetical protein